MDPENEWRIFIRNLSGTAGIFPSQSRSFWGGFFFIGSLLERAAVSSIAWGGRCHRALRAASRKGAYSVPAPKKEKYDRQ